MLWLLFLVIWLKPKKRWSKHSKVRPICWIIYVMVWKNVLLLREYICMFMHNVIGIKELMIMDILWINGLECYNQCNAKGFILKQLKVLLLVVLDIVQKLEVQILQYLVFQGQLKRKILVLEKGANFKELVRNLLIWKI